MKKRCAAVFRRCADRLDPKPAATSNIYLTFNAPPLSVGSADAMAARIVERQAMVARMAGRA